ncbi:alcohol dehydrogenase [Gluconobacter wancherniae]|uniref:Alcohol dehydrogenase n=1 Tax=Gluconobacter wancherniae NBRC 103581 TaxID=656744 RepID=A0A511B5A6_9PROT|nr:alcohol dehydrogenase [Gluconobacter wancherniae]MBF0854905.1 alcohol dehydrogenase [Gluconobacter wancherniae]MBS1064205.1 alcohol dehydrogenase [Gluconobacter wancherniae]MBS1089432.1 alcohol dehydrogenase [Gluconobacter wancherniae]MBS1095552.1 alcohol dehydrogenase [Gluconobacter wancherniae]GBD57928.1 alcohol dehydrogenase 15 kDa subunit [Gluconobacter wancherniae NBRC 103581]
MFRRIAPVIGLALGLAASAAHAQTPPVPDPIQGTPSKDFSNVSPSNLAGIMNYCTEHEYVSYEVGNPILYGLSEKYKTTEPNETGNYDYALGTAGQFARNGSTFIITAYTSIDDRKEACANAVKASQPYL